MQHPYRSGVNAEGERKTHIKIWTKVKYLRESGIGEWKVWRMQE